MPRATHTDNGPIRLVHVDDCWECGAMNSMRITENEVYQFIRCTSCQYEDQYGILHSEPLNDERVSQ